MQEMDDEAIADFFADVTPDEIIRYTAFHSRVVPPQTSFEGFLSEHLDVLRIAYASCDGEIHPITCLMADGMVHYFKAEDDETLGDYVGRVSRYGQLHNASMVFVFNRSQAAVDSKELKGLYWLAGEKSHGEVRYTHGYFDITDDKQSLGENLNAPMDYEAPNLFRSILEGSVDG